LAHEIPDATYFLRGLAVGRADKAAADDYRTHFRRWAECSRNARNSRSVNDGKKRHNRYILWLVSKIGRWDGDNRAGGGMAGVKREFLDELD
jgi:hypothetical protein